MTFVAAASDTDLDLMERLFAAAAQRPDRIPPAFLSYVLDHFQIQRPIVFASQIVGQLASLPITPATGVTASQSTTATAYGDLGTVGPSVPTLRDGSYLFLIQADMSISATTSKALMSLSFNGAGASDTGAISTVSTAIGTKLGYVVTSLSNSGSNTVVAKYRATGGTATFANRQVLAIRYDAP